MRLIGAILVAVLLSLAPPAYRTAAAQCDSTSSCLKAVETAQQRISTLSAQFVQTKYVSLLAEPIVSSGRLLLKRPDRVLWQVEKPQLLSVLIDAQGIHVPGMTEQDRQALAMTPMTALSSQLTAVLAGSLAPLHERFDVTASDAGDGVRIRLVPKEDALRHVFHAMEVQFAGPALALRDIRMEDAVGDRAEVRLDDVQINPDLPDSLFALPAAAAR